MSRLRLSPRCVLLLALAARALVLPAPRACAEATIEGTVALPPAGSVPVAKPRYPGGVVYEAGTPDPPAAVVYLEGSLASAAAEASAVAQMAQEHYQFAPGLLAVRKGTVVRFPNRDDEYHSVFSYSKTKRFDLGRYHKDETPAEITFDQVGVVKLFCEIHDHMRGTILVLDTPYFQKTDATGRYRLAALPAGRWVVKAWVDEADVREQSVELRDGQMLRVDFPGR